MCFDCKITSVQHKKQFSVLKSSECFIAKKNRMIMVNNSPVGIIVPKCFKLPIACDIEYGLKDQIVFKT